MTFLEAQKILASFSGGPPLRFLLAMSGTADALGLFVRAAAARRGRNAEIRLLPYGTLGQALVDEPEGADREVWLLMPWDFVPECDWRSGVPSPPGDREQIYRRAGETAKRLAARPHASILYVPAPVPPVFPDPLENSALAAAITAEAQAAGARVLSAECFALGAYVASGCPVAGTRLGDVAEIVVESASGAEPEPRKVLVTDFDNVLWRGVVGEDGPTGIACAPEGPGFRHFLYQTLLLRLKAEGVLLVGVTRNNPADALAPLRSGLTTVREDDFVAVLASYHPKSAQIKAAARQLNLGLDSFVFVDDNPVELAEVATELPSVTCLPFPSSDEVLPAFFEELRRLFARRVVTAEDQDRTAMYRRRLAGLVPSDAEGGDVGAFLRGLSMRLEIHDRSTGNRDRAVRLINKTNQFNVNGRRFTDAEIAEILAAGGRLYTATLADRTGLHGEILACLLSPAGVVEALVLSCRVFERRVEHAFVAWLSTHDAPKAVRYVVTPRNEPARKLLADPAFAVGADGLLAFDAASFAARHQADVELFDVTKA